MKDWTKYKLADLGEFKNGINYSADKAGSGIPVINVKDITDFHFINQHQLAVVDFPIKANSTIVSQKGDIFFVRSSVKREGAGEVAILKEINTTNTVHCGFVIRFRPLTEVDSIFFLYLFKSGFKRDQVRNLAAGATIYNISQDALKSIEIFLPSLPSQQRIGSILSSYDDLIETNNQRIKLLEQTARELYKEWFVRMRFPDYKKAKIVKGLPHGWVIKELQDCGNIFTGKTPPTKVREYYGGEIPFIKTPDLHKSLFVFDTEENLTEKGSNTQKRSTLPKDSICVSCIGTGGIVSITTAEKSQTNQQINSLVLSDTKHLEFLFHRIVDLKETIELYGGTGATMTNLSKGKFEKLKILFPKNELVEKYHFLVNPMFNQIKTLQQQNTQLRQIRDRLLPRLVSGKLQVKEKLMTLSV